MCVYKNEDKYSTGLYIVAVFLFTILGLSPFFTWHFSLFTYLEKRKILDTLRAWYDNNNDMQKEDEEEVDDDDQEKSEIYDADLTFSWERRMKELKRVAQLFNVFICQNFLFSRKISPSDCLSAYKYVCVHCGLVKKSFCEDDNKKEENIKEVDLKKKMLMMMLFVKRITSSANCTAKYVQ